MDNNMTMVQAMSRALGAAFLNHQVEQLEKSAASGNWRNRTSNTNNSPPKQRVREGANNNNANNASGTTRGSPRKKTAGVLIIPREPAAQPSGVRRSLEDPDRDRERERERKEEQDADVVVVDASVLVHALHQVKRWCREGRKEVVIVPLEALNTLDLLKKGSSLLAQRARAASRILEAQVGVNPRILVQRDDAFVPWDGINFAADGDATATPSETPTTAISKSTEADASAGNATATQAHEDPSTVPEWVRRTVCCARWEVDSASTAVVPAPNDSTSTSTPTTTTASDATPSVKAKTVLLAVLALSAEPPTPAVAGDVPNKHEPRAAGGLVGRWAARAGVQVLAVPPSAPPSTAQPTQREGVPTSSSRPRANTGNGAGPGSGPKRLGGGGEIAIAIAKRPNGNGNTNASGSLGRASGGNFGVIGGERGGGVEIAKRGGGAHARGGSGERERGGGGSNGGSLVERPPALLAMELKHRGDAAGGGAGGPRVVRVLARGEKLDGLKGA
ncbi:hypothetical protein C8R46DRAFT_1273153 [Mycena filopes]|nr:hypothetical protein C8R46DRAFT_1273153 [Mycena filopes]